MIIFDDLLVQYDGCIQARLEEYASDAANMDAIFNHEPIHYGEIVSLPFTGWYSNLFKRQMT
jgi:hypothetical protein